MIGGVTLSNYDCMKSLHNTDRFGLCVLEGGVALHAEGDGDGEVLRLGLVGLDGGRVVVEGLPLGRVAVPVEACRLKEGRKKVGFIGEY